MKNLLFILFCAFALPLFAQNGIDFVYDWNSATQRASELNKPIFMDAFTTWCGPCRLMSKNTFPDKKVGEFFNKNFVNLKLDMEKAEGPDIAKKYNVQVYPTLLFLNPEGEIIHRSAGYHDVADFIELGEIAIDPERQLSNMKMMFEKGEMDEKFLRDYAYAAYDAMDGSHHSPANAYLNTQSDWATEDNMNFIFKMVTSVDSDMFGFIVKHKDKFVKLFGHQEVERNIENLIYSSIYALGENPDLKEVDYIFEKANPAIAAKLSAKYRIRHYLELEEDDKFLQACDNYFKKFKPEDAAEYNEIGWTIYELLDNPKALKKGIKWTKKSIKLDDAYYNNDTLASLYFKIKNKKKAIKAAEHAIDIAKEKGEDYSATSSLLDNIRSL